MPIRTCSLIAAIMSFAALCGCSRKESDADAGIATQTLLLGNAAEPADLDPQVIVAWTDANICYSLFEALTWIDEKTGKPIPAAAKSWEVSADGLIYTFHLRPEGRWSNGDPVTADDFAFSYRRILTPTFAASYSYMLWPIKNAQDFNSGKITDFSQVGVKAIDPLTLQITLAHPTPYLPALAAHQTWLPVPRLVVEKFGKFDQKGTLWTRPGNLVSNGPFILKEWIPNGRIVVDKNPTYWDAAHVRLNHIQFFPIEEASGEELAFRAGQLQVTYSLPSSKLNPYRHDHPDELRVDERLASYYLFVNVNRPPLDNPKLRRALSLAIDREKIAKDVLYGSRTPAHAYTPPNCAGYTSRTQVPDDFDEARRLLAEAGYPGGKGLPTFEIESYSTDSSLRVLEAIQSRWEHDLGVHATITPLEQKTLFQNEQSHNFTIGFSAWIADYPDPSTFLDVMITGGGNNWAGWSNAAYDKLDAEAASTGDNAKRYELFQQAEKILLDEAPLIPLTYGQQSFLLKPYVHNWPPSALGFVHFTNVWLGR